MDSEYERERRVEGEWRREENMARNSVRAGENNWSRCTCMMILIYFIFHNSQELVMKMKMNLKQNESDYKCFDSSVGSLTYNPFRKL